MWEGKFFEEFRGKSFYRNGFVCVVLGGECYIYWFDGDGFVYCYVFDVKGVIYLGKFVCMKKFVEEIKVNCFLYNGVGFIVLNLKLFKNVEVVNIVNIVLLLVNNELWVLWEVVMFYKLNLNSLVIEG